MAIYHCSMKIIGRSSGRTAVAAAAYRAGENLYDQELQQRSDYTHKGGVVYSEIMLPEHAPAEYADRETLWNAVQKVEKSADAQLAREVEVALPRELTLEQQIELLRHYIQDNFVSRGMIADFAIHDKGDGNPHAHIMLTTRGLKENGQWAPKEKKEYALDESGQRVPIIDPSTGLQKVDGRNRKQWKRITVQANDWNDHSNAELWRAAWADHCNKFLTPENHIDHRSYARQGIDQEPTIHEGPAARQMEARGEVSDRCEQNREIRERNRLMAILKAQLEEVRRAIADVAHRLQLNVAEAFRAYQNDREAHRLTGELRNLDKTLTEMANDRDIAAAIVTGPAPGDFAGELVLQGRRRELEEKYGKSAEELEETLTGACALMEADRADMVARLQELRPGVIYGRTKGKDTPEAEKPAAGLTGAKNGPNGENKGF